jgi:hypothetical protein
LIENGRPNVVNDQGEMDDKHKEERCEQSDMVFMLMNIAVIPDEVVQKTHFNHLGWADIMKENMKQYKE